MIKNSLHKILILSLFIIVSSCIDEIPIETVSEFESVLVVEATITNEFKQQEIKLTRSYVLDSLEPPPELSAIVKVIGSNGFNMSFTETETGLYKSDEAFAAAPNVDYNLEIVTSDGREYASSNMQLTEPTTIDNLYIERDFNENDEEGVSIRVDAYDPTGNSKFYRYTYEETYKIIAPKYSPFELLINNDDFPYPLTMFIGFTDQELIDFFVTRQFRPVSEQVCYNTVASNRVIQENTNQFEEDRIDGFRLRFISQQNYIMSHRYSILVRQHIQSPEAFIYYKTLSDMSQTETVFSTTQPGFLSGNINSLTNSEEKVVGFFEVSSVDEKRVYFNYADLFPKEDLPPYFRDCRAILTPLLFWAPPGAPEIGSSPIQYMISQGRQYWDENLGSDGETKITMNPYQLVLNECGDCTFLGETQVPEFWED